MKITSYIVTMVMTMATGCHTGEVKTNATPLDLCGESTRQNSYWVCHAGNRRTIIAQGDFSAHFDLAALRRAPATTVIQAIGPVAGLRGEITIDGSVPTIAYLKDGKRAVETSYDHKAAFLVYGAAARWTMASVTHDINSAAELEAFVRAAATEAGLDLERPFPFRVEGRAQKLDYHIIYHQGGEAHGDKGHHRAMHRFEEYDTNLLLIGFWADATGEGVYTHPGKRTHLHFIDASRSRSGHVDNIDLLAGARLYLPDPRENLTFYPLKNDKFLAL